MKAKFDIKIGVIGPVAAGKSTLINAILVGKYNEVSIRRTTAGVNFFHLVEHSDEEGEAGEPSGSVAGSSEEADILREISEDNKVLRDQDGMSEKHFKVEVAKLFETRDDTIITIVDIPGLNEAGSSSKYRDYINREWDQFDCVILVMDARQGVNTEEQISLLASVKENNNSKKDIPVLILFNKVDDLDLQKKDLLLDEARAKISELFDIPESKDIVQEILDRKKSDTANDDDTDQQTGDVPPTSTPNISSDGKYLPIFLPISARNGYVYRLAPHVSEERFMELEKDLVELLGREQIGLRQWNALDTSERYQAAFDAISDPVVYQEGLKSSNFDSFLCLLDHCVGGSTTQQLLIERQMTMRIKVFPAKPGLADEMSKIFGNMTHLGMSTDPLKGLFWTPYKNIEEHQFEVFHRSFGDGKIFPVATIDELLAYHKLAVRAGWDDEAQKAIARAKQVLNRFVDAVLKTHRESDVSFWRKIYGLGQILTMSSNHHFAENFSNLKIVLEIKYYHAISTGKFCTYCEQVVAGECHMRDGSTCYEYPRTDTPSNINRCPRLPCCGSIDWDGMRCQSCGTAFEKQRAVPPAGFDFAFQNGAWSRKAPRFRQQEAQEQHSTKTDNSSGGTQKKDTAAYLFARNTRKTSRTRASASGFSFASANPSSAQPASAFSFAPANPPSAQPASAFSFGPANPSSTQPASASAFSFGPANPSSAQPAPEGGGPTMNFKKMFGELNEPLPDLNPPSAQPAPKGGGSTMNKKGMFGEFNEPLPDLVPSDPTHHGHLFWKFCKWMEEIENDKAKGTPSP